MSCTYLTFLLSGLSFEHDNLLRCLVQVVAQAFTLPQKASDLALQSFLSLVHDVNLEQRKKKEKNKRSSTTECTTEEGGVIKKSRQQLAS